MKANDFIAEIKADLQDKSSQWSNELLFVKLQRAYVSLQFDLPYFMAREEIAIVEGISEYDLKYAMIKNMTFFINDVAQTFVGLDEFYKARRVNVYTMHNKEVYLRETPLRDASGYITYKYEKELKTMNCDIELPSIYYEALRLKLLSLIHEKPTRNSKERNLSLHYIKLYGMEVDSIQKSSSVRAKNITSNYQKV